MIYNYYFLFQIIATLLSLTSDLCSFVVDTLKKKRLWNHYTSAPKFVSHIICVTVRKL